MEKGNLIEIEEKFNIIEARFLHYVNYCIRTNPYEEKTSSTRETYFHPNPFVIINESIENDALKKYEHELEGCMRLYLVNPMLKMLLDFFGYNNGWQYDAAYGNPSLSTREYELIESIEFVVEFQGRILGCKYTGHGFSEVEIPYIFNEYQLLKRNRKLENFGKYEYVDQILYLDWTSIDKSELSKVSQNIDRKESITLYEFFKIFFSQDIYNLFISKCKGAIKKAKNIISLEAIPRLTPISIFSFKDMILSEMQHCNFKNINYIFEKADNSKGILHDNDLATIYSVLFKKNYIMSLVGNSDFGKSFTTSEYLYRTLKEGLQIDYSSIVCGYIKSVEQLLFLFYSSAFGSDVSIKYWDKCIKDDSFNLSNSNYRYDPYCTSGSPEKQEYYYHKKKSENKSPTIGELIRFLRYNSIIWNISEEGKEYVCSCLEDFRLYCRNQLFHKHNINFDKYELVKRIRNNAFICICYILGGFKLLDTSRLAEKQLEITDYTYEKLYLSIPKKRGLWIVKASNGFTGLGFFSILDYQFDYVPNKASQPTITFVQADEENFESEIYYNKEYIEQHCIILSKEMMPIEIIRYNRHKK